MFARALILAVVFVPLAVPAQAQTPPALQHQHESGQPPERLGTVHFETSCSPAVKDDFNRAVALLHSFWFGAAAQAFTAVAEQDSSCAMAHWGVAMSRWGNPFGGARPVPVLEQGRAAAQKALAMKATDRERGYIMAVAALYEDFENRSHRDRTLAYERGMQRVSERHPQDKEAAIFYALAMNQTMLPTDQTYAQQLKAAAILEPLFKAYPDHPGVAHYLIHAYDHPPLAERALPAARLYAEIAPDAPHALHMPSHTFTRVGHWMDSVKTNQASADAARKANSQAEVLHALDYQVYAYLQMAHDRQARDVLDQAKPIEAGLKLGEQYGGVGLFALAAIPARYALERGAWSEAATLEARATPFPHVDAITRYARAIGAARGGHAPAAEEEVARLGELHAALVKSGEEYWAQQVEIQQRAARAWTAYAAGRHDAAVQELRAAADLEDSTDKSAISPGPLAPARELLGEMLLELKRPAEALKELEAVMKKEPNRFRATYFAARAAEQAGDAAKARQYYREVVRIAEGAEPGARPELREAREKAGLGHVGRTPSAASFRGSDPGGGGLE
jgi:tetratricopeptide (TPR) repeat protein